jgi:beta-lactamase regulating signal transducer with metallopeptidase domain
MLEQLLNNPFLYSLSLTLLHFLWQGLLVAVTLKSLLSIVANSESKLRYSLAILAMLANAILAVLTFIMVYPDTSSGANSNLSPIALTSLVSELTQQNPLLNYQELLPSILAYSLPYLSLLWLVSIAILASKLIIEIRNVNILPMRSSIAPSPELLVRFNQLVTQIQLTKTPQLLISLKAEVPMAIGWLKPVVLLPIAMITNLNSVQLEMLILHELAHIRRHDYLVNFFQTIIELLFFFHPSVHWVGKQIRNEREYCSDDIAVQHCGDAIAYAHTLTDTASLCSKKHFQTIPQMAMAASGGDLKARIIRLVDHHCAPTNYTSKWLAAFSLLIALSLLSINQLLTTPFAQQVNNKFPWQEQSISSKPAIIDLNTSYRSTILYLPPI